MTTTVGRDVWVLRIGSHRYGVRIVGVFATKELAQQEVRAAFKDWARSVGGSEEFHPVPDTLAFDGVSGASAYIERFAVVSQPRCTWCSRPLDTVEMRVHGLAVCSQKCAEHVA